VLTIFATAKPFHGHTGVIQRNAIASWTLLRPRPEIILFGNEPGTADLCREFGLRHVPELACTELGAPLLSDLFEKAQRIAAHDILCYVNSDIMLMGNFLEALRKVSQAHKRFLMVGRRWTFQYVSPGILAHGAVRMACGISSTGTEAGATARQQRFFRFSQRTMVKHS